MTRWLALLACLCLATHTHAEDEKAKEAPEVDPAIVKLVEDVQRVARGTDYSGMARFFDFDALVRGLEKGGYLRGVPEKRLAASRSKLIEGMQRAVQMPGGVIDRFESYAIRSVTKGTRPDTVLVYLRLHDADGLMSKVRWHLIKHADGWLIFDVEDLDIGFGYVQILGLMLVDALGGLGQDLRGTGRRFAQVQTLIVQEEFDKAHEILEDLEALDLPKVLATFVQLALASTTIARDELDEALGHLDAVAELQPGIPVEQYLRATIYNLQGKHAPALAAARRYIAMLDADALVNLELGIALHGLDRKPEALQALTAALREAPEDTEVLAYFALCLPEARRGELAGHFDALPDKVLGHRYVADVLLEHASAPLLRLFAGYFAKTHPQHYDVAHYVGHALYFEEKYRAAAAKFESAMRAMFSAPEAERPEDYGVQLTYMDALMDAWLALDDPIQAHDRALYEDYAFDYIAEELAYGKKDAVQLRKYIAHVGKSAPDDWGTLTSFKLGVYAVEADLLENKRGAAIQKLAKLYPDAEKQIEADLDDEEMSDLLWDLGDLYVRSLARAKRFEEALRIAESINARFEDRFYLALVHVLRGDTHKAIMDIRQTLRTRRSPEEVFEDEDLAAALKAPAYAALRKELLGDG